MKLRVKKLTPDGQLPTKAHATDAGWDLYAAEDLTVAKGKREIAHTQIAVEIPAGYFVSFRDRSGLVAKHGIHVLAGVIDSGYTGEWMVVLQNLGDEDYEIKKGERIAQAIIHQVHVADIEETEEIGETKRGSSGFGGSGK